MATADWTKRYCGVTHLNAAAKKSRATVVDHGSFAELQRWFPGCGFSPIVSQHETSEEAKAAGESWIAEAA